MRRHTASNMPIHLSPSPSLLRRIDKHHSQQSRCASSYLANTCMYPPASALPDLQTAEAAGKRVPPHATALTEDRKLAQAPDDIDKAVTYGLAPPSFTLPVALEGLEHPYNWSTRRWVSSIEGMSGRRRTSSSGRTPRESVHYPIGMRADCPQFPLLSVTPPSPSSPYPSHAYRAVYRIATSGRAHAAATPARKWLITLQAALLIFSCERTAHWMSSDPSSG